MFEIVPHMQYNHNKEKECNMVDYTKLKGSKTEDNLKAAFAGESMARMKYDYYASAAKKEGFEQISAIFTETSGNEKEHAKMWFKYLHEGAVPGTEVNLTDAAAGEHYEEAEMYPEFAKVAREEGFDEIAEAFEGVGKIEKYHEERYLKLLQNVKEGQVFVKEGDKVWQCRNCGHIHVGPEAPELCPVCHHPRAYFELEAKNY
jgi:rubrerythrin